MELPSHLATLRLTLRPWSFKDVESLVAYANDEAWAKFLPIELPYESAHAETFIAKQILLQPMRQRAYAIERENQAVGGINVRVDESGHIATLGYSIASRLWGQGLMSEGVDALIQTLFTLNPEIHRIQAYADSRNVGSYRVMEKVGMKREGILRKHRFLKGEWVNDVWYSILREEWAGLAE